jgi:Tol biopolymer transport system component
MLAGSDQHIDSLTWSRDGTQILYATPGNDRSTVLVSVSVADGRTRPFPTPAAAVAPSWSPTSDTVAYLEPTMEPGAHGAAPTLRISIKFVDGQGRPLHASLTPMQLQNGIVAWAPDGRRVAVTTVPANAPATIWVIEPGARTPFRKLIVLKPTQRPRGLAWTPDGTRLIIASEESLGDIVLHEIAR